MDILNTIRYNQVLKILVAFTILITGMMIGRIAHAADTNLNSASSVKDVQTQKISGEVLTKNNSTRKLTVQTDNGVKEVSVKPNTVINKNGFGSTFNDIKPNDQVTFLQSTGGEVLSMSVTASQIQDASKWALPAGLLALIGLVMLFSLNRQVNQNHFKTSISSVR